MSRICPAQADPTEISSWDHWSQEFCFPSKTLREGFEAGPNLLWTPNPGCNPVEHTLVSRGAPSAGLGEQWPGSAQILMVTERRAQVNVLHVSHRSAAFLTIPRDRPGPVDWHKEGCCPSEYTFQLPTCLPSKGRESLETTARRVFLEQNQDALAQHCEKSHWSQNSKSLFHPYLSEWNCKQCAV